MSAGVSPVPDEAVEAMARVLWEQSSSEYDYAWEPNAETYRNQAREVLAAALPFLREGIAAEVLGPVRELVREWGEMQTEDINQYALWQRLKTLSAPVQAAEVPEGLSGGDCHPFDEKCGPGAPCRRHGGVVGLMGFAKSSAQAAEEVGGDGE